jgi:hypothetical protein
MSTENYKQKQRNNVNSYSGSTEEHYRHVPMDLNSSPLEELFRDMFISPTTIAAAAESAASVSPPTLKAKPVSIPGAYNMKNHANTENRRRKRERGAYSVPNSMSNFALNDDGTRFPFALPPPGTQPNTQLGNSVFIVGSLEDKPPVPWPSSLTSPHDKDTCHYRTMEWPVSYHQRTTSSVLNRDDDQSIFSMDDDYHSASDFYDEEDDVLVFDRA